MQPIRTRLVLAALGLAMAVPVTAQDPAPAPDAPAADAPAADTPAAPEAPDSEAPDSEAPAPETPAGEAPAAPGAPVTDAPAAAGDPARPEVMEIVRDTFGDWEVRCAPEGDECFMYQLALDDKQNPVAEVSILKLPEAAEADAGVTVVTPLGTLLTTGIGMQVDGGERRQYPFGYCIQVGCFARFGLDRPGLDAMKRGGTSTITLVPVASPNAPVTLDLSLSGFTAAFDSLQALAPPAGAGPATDPVPAPTPAPAPALEPAPLAPRN